MNEAELRLAIVAMSAAKLHLMCLTRRSTRHNADSGRALGSLTKLIDKLAAQYATDAKSADAILKVGIAPPPSGMNPADLAVWTNIARVILNLHETVVRS